MLLNNYIITKRYLRRLPYDIEYCQVPRERYLGRYKDHVVPLRVPNHGGSHPTANGACVQQPCGLCQERCCQQAVHQSDII